MCEARKAEAVISLRKTNTVQRMIGIGPCADCSKFEQFFGRIKHYRCIATRCEKTARIYLDFWDVV